MHAMTPPTTNRHLGFDRRGNSYTQVGTDVFQTNPIGLRRWHCAMVQWPALLKIEPMVRGYGK